MGLQVSLDEKKVPKEWQAMFKTMKFSRGEVKKLHDIFDKLDTKQKGGIDIVEWLTFLDLERNTFTERIFRTFDKDGNRVLDFYEFVVSLWKFCTLGEGSINVFAFDLYDMDADGIMQLKEVQLMFRELMGSKVYELETSKTALAELVNITEDGTVNIEDFRVFTKTHQALLYQVFHIQTKLKDNTLGWQLWEGISKRRIELRRGYNVQIANLMVLHSDRKLFRHLLEDQTIMRVSSKMKLVLENTDNSNRTQSTMDSNHFNGNLNNNGNYMSAKPSAQLSQKPRPNSSKKSKKGKVLPKITQPTNDLMHHHFPGF